MLNEYFWKIKYLFWDQLYKLRRKLYSLEDLWFNKNQLLKVNIGTNQNFHWTIPIIYFSKLGDTQYYTDDNLIKHWLQASYSNRCNSKKFNHALMYNKFIPSDLLPPFLQSLWMDLNVIIFTFFKTWFSNWNELIPIELNLGFKSEVGMLCW